MKIIEYPNSLLDLVTLHYQGHQKIGIMVRPKEKGIYQIKVTPDNFTKLAQEHTLEFIAKDDAPQTVLFDFFKAGINHNQPYLKCTWQLTKKGKESNSSTDTFSLAWQNIDPKSDDSRIAFWSCHQPYKKDSLLKGLAKKLIGNTAVLMGTNTVSILDWYQTQIEEFKPHTIWGAGDTSYSDGVKNTNFIKQYYNNKNWETNFGKANLTKAYRKMYQHHWSMPQFNNVLQRYPHLFTWDDHEIIDGWGSNDKDNNPAHHHNQVMCQVAKSVAKEYILDAGPLINPKSGETHKSYITGNMACFVFDTRSTRNYNKPGKLKTIISEEQFHDFEQFVTSCKTNTNITNVVVSTSTPFVHIRPMIVSLLSDKKIWGLRDDIRDSWGSKKNLPSLTKVLFLLDALNNSRDNINIFNLSGDVHVANAFAIYHKESTKPIYQVTSSALTNREHPNELIDWAIRLPKEKHMEGIGNVVRIWDTVTEPNILHFTSKPDGFECKLQVKPKSGSGKNKNKYTNIEGNGLFAIEYK